MSYLRCLGCDLVCIDRVSLSDDVLWQQSGPGTGLLQHVWTGAGHDVSAYCPQRSSSTQLSIWLFCIVVEQYLAHRFPDTTLKEWFVCLIGFSRRLGWNVCFGKVELGLRHVYCGSTSCFWWWGDCGRSLVVPFGSTWYVHGNYCMSWFGNFMEFFLVTCISLGLLYLRRDMDIVLFLALFMHLGHCVKIGWWVNHFLYVGYDGMH